MHPHIGPNSYVIEANDVGREAYCTAYVRSLKTEIEKLRGTVNVLVKEREEILRVLPDDVRNEYAPHVATAVCDEIKHLDMLCRTARSIIKSMVSEMPENTPASWYRVVARWLLATMKHDLVRDQI